MVGFEPTTYRLRNGRSTVRATPAWCVDLSHHSRVLAPRQAELPFCTSSHLGSSLPGGVELLGTTPVSASTSWDSDASLYACHEPSACCRHPTMREPSVPRCCFWLREAMRCVEANMRAAARRTHPTAELSLLTPSADSLTAVDGIVAECSCRKGNFSESTSCGLSATCEHIMASPQKKWRAHKGLATTHCILSCCAPGRIRTRSRWTRKPLLFR